MAFARWCAPRWASTRYLGHLFVFLGRPMDRCRSLFWERGGFIVYYKRLEKGRFRLPRPTPEGGTVTMDPTGLLMLLDGIRVRYVGRPVLRGPKP